MRERHIGWFTHHALNISQGRHCKRSLTAIPRWTYGIPSDLPSQATLGLVSTWIGDGLGIRGAVSILLLETSSIHFSGLVSILATFSSHNSLQYCNTGVPWNAIFRPILAGKRVFGKVAKCLYGSKVWFLWKRVFGKVAKCLVSERWKLGHVAKSKPQSLILAA